MVTRRSLAVGVETIVVKDTRLATARAAGWRGEGEGDDLMIM